MAGSRVSGRGLVMPRNLEVERVAETHFFIRPVLLRALELQHVTDQGRTMWNTHSTNWRELWTEQLSDRWFDMATVIRLGTALETGLRDAYNRLGQGGDPQGGRGVFQRLVNDADVVAAFLNDCGGLDLRSSAEWPVIREVMLYRHLYAHRSGEVDEEYLDAYERLTGVDLRHSVAQHGYPAQPVYSFEPLTRLPNFIEAARRFFRFIP